MAKTKEEGKMKNLVIFFALSIGFACGLAAQAQEMAPEIKMIEDTRVIAHVMAIDNVCAFPNLTLMRDGTIIATIKSLPVHSGGPSDVECWASTDGGWTWQKHGTPAPHEPNTNRMNVAAGLAKNGDLIVLASGSSNKLSADSGKWKYGDSLRPWICRSKNGGRTWTIDKESLPDDLPRSRRLGRKKSAVPFGDIIKGQDGSLRAAFYNGSGAYVYTSRDDGKTWGEFVPIDEKNTRYEPAIFHLGSGKWLAAVRINGLHLYESNDDARTWQYRELLTGKSQHPGHFQRLADGRLLLTYGNRTKSKGVDVRFSEDEGKTWSDPMRLIEFWADGGYPSSIQRPDGRIVTAYYTTKSKYHHRYHMGVVIWDPEKKR